MITSGCCFTSAYAHQSCSQNSQESGETEAKVSKQTLRICLEPLNKNILSQVKVKSQPKESPPLKEKDLEPVEKNLSSQVEAKSQPKKASVLKEKVTEGAVFFNDNLLESVVLRCVY